MGTDYIGSEDPSEEANGMSEARNLGSKIDRRDGFSVFLPSRVASVRLGSLFIPLVTSAHDSLSSPFNPLREPLRGRVKRERSGCEERRE